MADDAGFVYAFLAVGRDLDGSRVLKIGRTIDWEKRRVAYTGLDAPDPDTLLVRRTSAPVLLEATTKRMLMEMFRVHSGYERFVVPEASAASVMRWVAATIDTHPLDARLYMQNKKCKTDGKKRKFCHISSVADQMLDMREELEGTADDAQDEENGEEKGKEEDVACSDVGPLDRQGVIRLKDLVSLRHMLRHYLIVIAPMERNGTTWRSVHTWMAKLGNELDGRRRANKFNRIINRDYQPCLLAVLRTRDEKKVSVWEAADMLESRRGHWTDFAALMKQQNNALDLGRFRAYIAELNSKAFGDQTLASA